MLRHKVYYVPAGLEAWQSGTVHAYTKFGKQKTIGLERSSGKYSIFRFPDREVHVTNASSGYSTLLDPASFDTITPILSPEIINEPIVLINPYHATKNYKSDFQAFGKKVIVDSGGFQMLRGTANFIDIDKLCDFYNANASICMPLDLPLPQSAEPDFFDAVTKMMKANDEYMLPRLKPGRVLALISQGSTVKNRLKRIKALDRTPPVVAIAGLNTTTGDTARIKNMVALSNALSVVDALRDSTEYFHFLGVTSNLWFILYSIMVGTGYVRRCGGDSVSARLTALNGTYAYGLGGASTGKEHLDRKQVTPIGTTCRCPVCRILPDQRAFHDARLAESHSLFNAIETKNLIADSVELYLAGKTSLKAISRQWLGKGKYPLLAEMVDYLTTVIQTGYKEWSTPKVSSLFSTSPAGLSLKGTQHFNHIIERYETFHGKSFK